MDATFRECYRTCVIGGALWMTAVVCGAQERETAPVAPKLTEVYRSQFDKHVEVDRWSPVRAGQAPGGRRFLGEYSGSTPLVLRIDDLPEHRFIRLRADLLVLRSWDGLTKDLRPDTWGINEVGGPLLLLTTFCNPMKRIPVAGEDPPPPLRVRHQCFPDEYPFALHDPATGSSGKGGKLGIKFRDDLEATNTIYEIDLVFPHTDKDLALRFFGRLTEGASDESWALDNVVVEAVDRESPLDKKRLEELWGKLSGKDPVVGNTALWEIVGAGEAGRDFVLQRWNEFLEPDPEKQEAPEVIALRAKIEKILERRGAEDFLTRQRAQKSLVDLDEDEVLDLLIEYEARNKDPEVALGLAAAIDHQRKRRVKMAVNVHKNVVRSRVMHIGRIFETRANDYRITSSPVKKPEHPFDEPGAAADGYVALASNHAAVPRWNWYPNRGTSEWLQYDFPRPRVISKADVAWYSAENSGSTSLPESWKVLYQDAAGNWKPVEHDGEYPVVPDQYNGVRFKPVTTKAVRLAVELKEGRSAGLHEFRVSNPPDKGR